ncbi:MAG: hypothetical protein LBV51_01875 [Acholeplasmatales bacterium]|jgi:hypothetical protein|nr:hypothetical protein [Acholeplasmatales bacterium]
MNNKQNTVKNDGIEEFLVQAKFIDLTCTIDSFSVVSKGKALLLDNSEEVIFDIKFVPKDILIKLKDGDIINLDATKDLDSGFVLYALDVKNCLSSEDYKLYQDYKIKLVNNHKRGIKYVQEKKEEDEIIEEFNNNQHSLEEYYLSNSKPIIVEFKEFVYYTSNMGEQLKGIGILKSGKEVEFDIDISSISNEVLDEMKVGDEIIIDEFSDPETNIVTYSQANIIKPEDYDKISEILTERKIKIDEEKKQFIKDKKEAKNKK